MVVRHTESSRKIALEYALIVSGLVLLVSILGPTTNTNKSDIALFENSASAIGVSAAIAPNEYNTLAEQFEQKETELTARERELGERERALGEQYKNAIAQNERTTLIVVGGVTVFLLVLIFLNFYLDIERQKNERTPIDPHKGELQTRL